MIYSPIQTSLSVRLFFFLLFLILILFSVLYFKQRKANEIQGQISGYSPMDNPSILNRFSRLRQEWYKLSVNQGFKELANNLMDINSESLLNNVGNKNILMAYQKLDEYIRNIPMDKDIRVTLIYTDGIVFYDSSLPLHRVYFLQNGLPRPVSMATLASPLKNHNVVPEMTNAVNIHNVTNDMVLLGYPLKNPLYKQLVREGFGFFERISSSLNVPYSYMAKFLSIPSGNGDKTFFLDGCILRIGVPITDNLFDQKN